MNSWLFSYEWRQRNIMRFRSGAFTWSKRWKETADKQGVERLKRPVTVVKRSELCRATTALSVMDRDTLTCAPAVADGLLALQVPGKSCEDSGGTHSCFKRFPPSFQENVDKTSQLRDNRFYQIHSNSLFTSYLAILRYVACHTGRIVNSNINNR